MPHPSSSWTLLLFVPSSKIRALWLPFSFINRSFEESGCSFKDNIGKWIQGVHVPEVENMLITVINSDYFGKKKKKRT